MATIKCKECGADKIGVTLGFNERTKRAQKICDSCRRELGPMFKADLCRLTPEQNPSSRTCIVARGRLHIHTSQGALYVPECPK